MYIILYYSTMYPQTDRIWEGVGKERAAPDTCGADPPSWVKAAS